MKDWSQSSHVLFHLQPIGLSRILLMFLNENLGSNMRCSSWTLEVELLNGYIRWTQSESWSSRDQTSWEFLFNDYCTYVAVLPIGLCDQLCQKTVTLFGHIAFWISILVVHADMSGFLSFPPNTSINTTAAQWELAKYDRVICVRIADTHQYDLTLSINWESADWNMFSGWLSQRFAEGHFNQVSTTTPGKFSFRETFQ